MSSSEMSTAGRENSHAQAPTTMRRSGRACKTPVDILATPAASKLGDAPLWSLVLKFKLSPEKLRPFDAEPTQLPTPQTGKRKSYNVDLDSDSTGGSPTIQRRRLGKSPHDDDRDGEFKLERSASTDSQATTYASTLTERETPTLPSSPLQTMTVALPPSPPIFSNNFIKLSDELFTSQMALWNSRGSTRPDPSQQPPVWAERRMELCETLHYYRAYHGACYATGGFAQAFMFADGAHQRDYMDGSVVICRAGGGMVANKDTGAREMSGDRTEDSVVRSLRNNIAQYNPVVILVGEKNPLMPSKIPHPYCVLDYFKPTHIWYEKTNGKKFIRYRFEKLNSNGSSWWQPKGTTEIAPPGSLEPPVTQTCSDCGVDSQMVYGQGWMCLQPNCNRFWKLELASGDLQEPEEDTLTYDPRFLKQKTRWAIDNNEYPLGSIDAELSGQYMVGEDCLRAQWSGIVCPQCGRCNSRLEWTGWTCLSPGCSWEKRPPHTLIPAAALHDAFNPVSPSYMPSRDSFAQGVTLSVSFAHNYRINRFEIPGVKGFITHLIANKTVVEETGGPNDMYEEIQGTDIGLMRRPMGQDYFTRHYTVNYGIPYKFIAATASHSFDGSARPITATRSRLNWAAKCLLSAQDPTADIAITEDWKEFNEVLALGYYENQKISYHDDGETGLGPTIATLSLGDTGTMRIRMKAKHHNGVTKAGVYDTSTPLPGSTKYEERLEIAKELKALQDGGDAAKAELAKRLKALPNELGLKKTGNAKDTITMTVAHGDIVIMHGYDIQKYYEHSVDHSGKLRFALTCRYIDPSSLAPADQPQYMVKDDTEHYDGSLLPLPGH